MRQLALDAIGLAGLAAFVGGVYQVHAPSAWMVGGLLTAGATWLASGKKGTP